MFDFQKLEVYKKAKLFHSSCKKLIRENNFDNFVKDQLGRASFSVPLKKCPKRIIVNQTFRMAKINPPELV